MATRRMTPEEEQRLRQAAEEEHKRLAQELWEHRDDSDEWEDEPTDFLVASNPGVVYSIRFTADEFHRVSELARREGLTIDDLIRTALLKPEPPLPRRVPRHRTAPR
jgi:hypothetical protein